MGNIYLASYVVQIDPTNTYRHSYLVYDPNSDLGSTSDQSIIRGGPEVVAGFWEYLLNFGDLGSISVESGLPSTDSLDGLNNIADTDEDGFTENDKNEDGITDTALSRNYELLAISSTLWDDMVDFAVQLVGNTIDYSALGTNSNSVINSILSAVGLDFRAQILPGAPDASYFPGHMNVLDGSGNSNFTIFAYGGQTTAFHKQAGVDVLIVKAGGEVALQNAVNNGFTTITLEGVSRAQAVFGAAGDDLTLSVASNEIVRIENYQTTGATIGAEFRFTDAVYQRGTDAANSFNPHSAGTAYVYEGFDGSDIYYIDLAAGFANAHTVIETITDGDNDTLVINGAGAGITWEDVMVLEDSVAGIWSVTIAGHPAFGASIFNVDTANDTSPLERITISGLGTRDIVDLRANDHWQEITLNDGTWAFSTTTLTDTADDGELTGTAGNDNFYYSWDDWSNNAWSGFTYPSVPFVVHQYGFGGNDNLSTIGWQIVIGSTAYNNIHVIRHGGDGDDALDGGIEQYGDAGNDRLLNAPLMVGGANDNSVHDSVYGNRKAA